MRAKDESRTAGVCNLLGIWLKVHSPRSQWRLPPAGPDGKISRIAPCVHPRGRTFRWPAAYGTVVVASHGQNVATVVAARRA
jgi:hypothetical protein